MKTSRYTEAQIIVILRQAEGAVVVAELCREHGMRNASFDKWRAKYGGMDLLPYRQHCARCLPLVGVKDRVATDLHQCVREALHYRADSTFGALRGFWPLQRR